MDCGEKYSYEVHYQPYKTRSFSIDITNFITLSIFKICEGPFEDCLFALVDETSSLERILRKSLKHILLT